MDTKEIAVAILEQMKALAAARFYKQGFVLQSHEGGYMHNLSPKQEAEIKRLEARGSLVYHVISGSYLWGGNPMDLETYLLITQEDADACKDSAFLKEYLNAQEMKEADVRKVFAYVKNLSWPDCSEYGYFHVKANGNAGLCRKA